MDKIRLSEMQPDDCVSILMYFGLSTRDIAEKLGVSAFTVNDTLKNHRNRSKLFVSALRRLVAEVRSFTLEQALSIEDDISSQEASK